MGEAGTSLGQRMISTLGRRSGGVTSLTDLPHGSLGPPGCLQDPGA